MNMFRLFGFTVFLTFAVIVSGKIHLKDKLKDAPAWIHHGTQLKTGLKDLQNVLIHHGTPQATGCECIHYDCGCCLHVKISDIHLDDTVCANVTYLPDQYGVSLTFSIDGKVYINETVSAKNPPPICVGVPHLKQAASICIDLHDLDITNKVFKGCVALEARLYHVFVEKVELGCFSIPLAKQKGFSYYAENQQIDAEWLNTMKMMSVKKRMMLSLN